MVAGIAAAVAAAAVAIAIASVMMAVRCGLSETHLCGGALMIGQMMMVDNGLHLFGFGGILSLMFDGTNN